MIFCSSHERARGHATNTISAQDFFMVVNDNKKHLPGSFSGEIMQFMNLIELLIFPLKRESRVSRHPPYARPEVVVHGNLHVNKYGACDLKISFAVTMS